jgi:oligosaccharide repeat unit polymerase
MTDLLGRWIELRVSTSAFVECLFLLLFCSVNGLLIETQQLEVSTQAYITLVILGTVTFLAWYRFDGGMHPCFLFLSLLMIFQGGKLFSMLLGATQIPFRIDLQTAVPFDVNQQATLTTLLMLATSAVLIYCSCRISYNKRAYTPGLFASLAGWAVLLFCITYPFHLYKNVKYLEYALKYGYVALYFDNGEHLKQVGILCRTMSQICVGAFSLYFCWEQSKKKLLLVTIPFLIATVAELLMGLRGKSLLFFVCFLFLYKLKFNQRFSIMRALPLALVLIVVCVSVASFREGISADDKPDDSPLVLFLNTQGVSFQVSQMAVANRDSFSKYRWNYLVYPFLAPFRHQSEFSQGERFSNDLSVSLNAPSFSQGYATGSSYLAEAYLIGKGPGVILCSVLIGAFLAVLSVWLSDWRSPFAVLILISVIFVPRAELVDPLAASIKPLFSFAALLGVILLLHAAKQLWMSPHEI